MEGAPSSTPAASRLILGTAQLGSAYGIANRAGLPPYEAAREIIRQAAEGGIGLLDTAPAYGQSEAVIGRALEELGLAGRLAVATKIGPIERGLPPAEARRRIEESLRASLRQLRLDRVAMVLFHREYNLEYADELLALRERGLFGAAGVSLVHPEFAARALRLPGLTAWQIPTNILDRRFTHSGLGAGARAAGATVMVRSVYLQGLILLDDAATPPHLARVIPARARMREIARRFGLPLPEFAVRAILSRPEISSLVVGMETAEQLRDNLALVAKGPLPPEVLAELEAFDPALPQAIVSPPEWEALKASKI